MGKEIETESYILAPDPDAARLTRAVTGRDQNGEITEINVRRAAFDDLSERA